MSDTTILPPVDQDLRSTFIRELDVNFDVSCPAGSGKTRSLTDRIAAYAARSDARKVLPKLVVTTFTEKSAQEIQERARAQILAAKPDPTKLSAFNRAFFGTIHSFGISLLRKYGHFIGVPSIFEVAENEDALWRDFLQQHNGKPSRMSAEVFSELTRVYPYESLLDLVRAYTFTRPLPLKAGKMPLPDLAEVLNHPLPKRANQAANIEAHQKALKNWRSEMLRPGDFLPLPDPTTGGEEFLSKVAAALAKVKTWMGLAVSEAVHDLALDYRAFRVAKGQLTFNDQVALAASLLRNGRAARAIRSQGYRVILDEAQDTDIHQFDLLVEIARPVSAGKERFLETLKDGPGPGHFTMVGDGEQALYGDRADLGYYLAVRHALLSTGCARELNFSVTFRCDQAIVDFANATCPAILNGRSGQVPYVTLAARPNVEPGQVIRFPVRPELSLKEGGATALALHEARRLGAWLRDTGLARLRAKTWSQVALLCPRKDWFAALRQGLAEAGLPCQFQSTREIYGDSPAFAWLTALCTVWAEPKNALEIFGTLREVFGISDHDIAVFVDRRSERMSIETGSTVTGTVADALNALSSARVNFGQYPLREALGRACKEIDLRGRLAALPVEVYSGQVAELDTLLLRASEAEARGFTLEAFAAEMRSLFEEPIKVAEAGEDSLPIITNLKAKGLQWDCVVVPFFGREISFRAQPYPRFLPAGCAKPIAFGSGDIPEEWKNRIAIARLQELERVLYVTLTRAKHTMVIVDDRELWCGVDGDSAKNSFASTLRVDDENAKPLMQLPQECATFDTAQGLENAPTEQLKPVSFTEPGVIPEAANRFPKRYLPHTLVAKNRAGRKIEDPEQAATVNPDQLVAELDESDAIKYGSWWHALMQATPWDGMQVDREGVFACMLDTCPDPDRGKLEWEALLKSDLWAELTSGAWRIHVEMPFMAPLTGGDSVDGIADLAAFHKTQPRCMVADWKTNRGIDLETLAENYRPQVAVYRDSLSAMTGLLGTGIVYSTVLGQSIAV